MIYDTDTLIALAQQRGIALHRRTLTDWAQRGLIAHPVRRGRGQGHGVRFEWPHDTLERIEAIAPAMKGFHDARFPVILLWLLGFDLPLTTVKMAMLSTRALFNSFAATRNEMIEHLGLSSSRDAQADWLSRYAVKMTGTAAMADDMEALFHLFIADYPDLGVIDSMIDRAAADQSMQRPLRKTAKQAMNFLRHDFPLNTLISQAYAKSDSDWARARREWLQLLRSARRLSESLTLNQAAFRLVGYQFVVIVGPLVFLTLLIWQNPKKRHWLATIDKITRDFQDVSREEPALFSLLRSFILKRVYYAASKKTKLGPFKPRF